MLTHVAYCGALLIVAALWAADHYVMREELDKQWRLYVQAKHAAEEWHCRFDLIDPIRIEAWIPLSDECEEVLFGKEKR